MPDSNHEIDIHEAAAVLIAVGTIMVRYGIGVREALGGNHDGDLLHRIVEEGIDGNRAEELLDVDIDDILDVGERT